MFENIGKYRTHCRREPSPGRPALLLTSAWPFTIRCWDSSWPGMKGSYDLTAYDMPGFGLSQGSSAMMRPSAQGEFALQLMDHFGLEKVHGVVPDVGVPVMLWLAEHHPERIQSLVLIGGPGFYPYRTALRLRAIIRSGFVRGLVAQEGVRFGDSAIHNGYYRHQPSEDAVNEYRQFYRDPQRFGPTLNFLASFPDELSAIGDGLDIVSCPVLILWGSKDTFMSFENGYEMSRRIRGSHFELLCNCGHYAAEDAGHSFVDRLERWYAEVDYRTPTAAQPQNMLL